MIAGFLKNAFADFWDEMLYLVIFNLIWIIGVLLIIPGPPVTFGLFFTVYNIGQGKGIKFSTFWNHVRRTWPQAYLWGGINLVVLAVVWINLNFYAHLEAAWAGYAQMVMIALALFWLSLQLLALAFYPRLERPSFKLALREAAITMGRYPLPLLIFLISIVLILILTFFFPILIFMGTFSIIAVLANRLVDAAQPEAILGE